MNNVSRLYRDSEYTSDTPDGATAANQSSIGSSPLSSVNSLSGQGTLDDIRNLLIGDHASRQSAEISRLNSKIESLESSFISKLNEQNNEISHLKGLLQQADHERNSVIADQNAFKASSEAALYEIQALYARKNEDLQSKVEQQLASQSERLSQALKQVAELLTQNASN